MNEASNGKFAQAAGCLSPPVFGALQRHFAALEDRAQEIRLRLCRPLTVVCTGQTYFITKGGGLTDLPCDDLLTVGREDIGQTFQRLCDYSVYAHMREIRGGFLTLRGGHRAGICGTAVTGEGGVVNVRDISSINLRIAREHKGCADALFRRLYSESGGVLLCGEPCSGKTTVLRDLARQLSLTGRLNVSLIDERGELAAAYMGAPQNDVGLCDVFDGYPKAYAMEQALRSMSPQVIVCDEIGSKEDAAAVRSALNCGVRVIAAAHAKNRSELLARESLRDILGTGAFSTVVFLRGRERAGEVSEIVAAGERLAA